MKKRWYDHDPAMSMAISLLQNAPPHDQQATALYILGMLEADVVVQQDKAWKVIKIDDIFNFSRRNKVPKEAARLIEVLKVLPNNVQLEMAMNIINHIYLLEAARNPQAIVGVVEQAY